MYKVIRNKPVIHNIKSGADITVYPSTEYSIYWVKDEHKIHILDIKDHFQNPEGIGEGICKSLNKGDIILDLNV